MFWSTHTQSNRSLPRYQDSTVCNLAALQPIHRLLYAPLRHRERLDNRLNLMPRGKSQHLTVQMPRGHERSLHRDPLQDQPHVRDFQVAGRDRERVDGRSGSHDGQDEFPVRRHRCRDEQSVDRSRDLELRGVLGGDELVCAEPQGFGLFPLGAGEDHDAAAHLGRELNREMAEPADAHDADRVAGLDVLEGGEGGGAAALEGSGVDVAETLRDGIEE